MTDLSSNNKRFRRGDSVYKALDHDYLNSLDERIRRLENISVASPLKLEKTRNGIHISLDKRVMNWFFVEIALDGTPGPDGTVKKDSLGRECNELDPYEDAVAYIMKLDGRDPFFESYNFKTDRQFRMDGDGGRKMTIWVVDVFGISSQPKTYGIAFEHPNSQIKRWIFVPSPVGGGENIPNYKYTKHQALAHSGAGDKGIGGIVQWVDIDTCE